MRTPPSLSIIVPVLNEAPIIGNFLRHVREVAPEAEIIVVDGGSVDGTREIAGPLADHIISTIRGRAVQMNAGAAVAGGSMLWFLHADLHLPVGAPQMIEDALREWKLIGGWFRLRFPCRRLIYRVSDSVGNLGADVFGFALGDHAIFCQRAAFCRVGGYPVVPILEDAELCRRLARMGRMKQLGAEVTCSPRGYEQYGPYRTTAVYFFILVLYVFGTSISFLNRIYCAFRHSVATHPLRAQCPDAAH